VFDGRDGRDGGFLVLDSGPLFCGVVDWTSSLKSKLRESLE
jgi:hypothetical protein